MGKSLVAALLAQYLGSREAVVHCFDTDPINTTLAHYEALGACVITLMDGDDIDPRRFDVLMEALLALPEEAHAVIDNGAATFVPLCSYLLASHALEALEDAGHAVMIHTVVTGGQAAKDTLFGMKSLLESFASTPHVIWLNPFFGEVMLKGKAFEEFQVCQDHREKFHAIVRIPQRKGPLFGEDLRELFASHQTFAQGADSTLPVMTRQRLKMYWRDAATEMDKAQLC